MITDGRRPRNTPQTHRPTPQHEIIIRVEGMDAFTISANTDPEMLERVRQLAQARTVVETINMPFTPEVVTLVYEHRVELTDQHSMDEDYDNILFEHGDTPIHSFGLSKRVQNALEHVDICTILSLVERSEAELHKIKNFGKGAMEEVQKKILEPLRLKPGLWRNVKRVRERIEASRPADAT